MKTRKMLALAALILMLRIHWKSLESGEETTGTVISAEASVAFPTLIVRLEDGKIGWVKAKDVFKSEWVEVVAGTGKP